VNMLTLFEDMGSMECYCAKVKKRYVNVFSILLIFVQLVCFLYHHSSKIPSLLAALCS